MNTSVTSVIHRETVVTDVSGRENLIPVCKLIFVLTVSFNVSVIYLIKYSYFNAKESF